MPALSHRKANKVVTALDHDKGPLLCDTAAKRHGHTTVNLHALHLRP